MNFIELTSPAHEPTQTPQKRYLFDIDSGWMINDEGEKPASWANPSAQWVNAGAWCIETYAQIRARLVLTNIMLADLEERPQCIVCEKTFQHSATRVLHEALCTGKKPCCTMLRCALEANHEGPHKLVGDAAADLPF